MVDYTKPILFGTNLKTGKVYVGYGKLSAKMIRPGKDGKVVYNGKKYSLVELFENKSEDYKEWH